MDGAEADEAGALRVNGAGTRNVAALGAPGRLLLLRLRLRRLEARAVRRVRRAGAARRVRAHEAPRRARGAGRLDRPQLVALRLDRAQLRADDAPARCRAGRGAASSTTSAAAPPTSATWRRRRGSWSRCRAASGTWRPTVSARGPSSPPRSSRRPASTAASSPDQHGGAGPRRRRGPAYSVLRSEREGAPQLPHWREGLRACLARISAAPRSSGRVRARRRSSPQAWTPMARRLRSVTCASSSPAAAGSSAATSSSASPRPARTSSCSTS